MVASCRSLLSTSQQRYTLHSSAAVGIVCCPVRRLNRCSSLFLRLTIPLSMSGGHWMLPRNKLVYSANGVGLSGIGRFSTKEAKRAESKGGLWHLPYIFIIFIHRSHGRWIQNNKKNVQKNTHIQQSSSAYLLHQCCNNYYAENIYLFNVTLDEFYRHDCRISESSLASLTTNRPMLHNLFGDTVYSCRWVWGASARRVSSPQCLQRRPSTV